MDVGKLNAIKANLQHEIDAYNDAMDSMCPRDNTLSRTEAFRLAIDLIEALMPFHERLGLTITDRRRGQ